MGYRVVDDQTKVVTSRHQESKAGLAAAVPQTRTWMKDGDMPLTFKR